MSSAPTPGDTSPCRPALLYEDVNVKFFIHGLQPWEREHFEQQRWCVSDGVAIPVIRPSGGSGLSGAANGTSCAQRASQLLIPPHSPHSVPSLNPILDSSGICFAVRQRQMVSPVGLADRQRVDVGCGVVACVSISHRVCVCVCVYAVLRLSVSIGNPAVGQR